MKKEISWQYNPPKESNSFSWRQKFILIGILTLAIIGIKIPNDFKFAYYLFLLFTSLPFLFIFFLLLMVRFSKKNRSPQTYTIDEGGIRIFYADKNETYLWSDIEGWTGSVEEMKSDKVTVSEEYNEPETAIFITMSKKKNRVLINFPPAHYNSIVETLNQHTRHISPEEVGRLLK